MTEKSPHETNIYAPQSSAPPAAEVSAMAEFIGNYLSPRVVTVEPSPFGDISRIPILLAPEGMQVIEIGKAIEALRPCPNRRRGTANVQDLESFIAHTNRHKDAASAIYADPTRAKPSLTAIFNYNLGGCEFGTDYSLARFGDHRVVYTPPLSDEYKAWSGINGKELKQFEFAEFIEDRITDMVEPPEFDGEEREYNLFLKQFADLVGGKFATPSRMMELARGVKVTAGHKVSQIVNTASGEGKISFSEEHKDENGAPISIPNIFLIVIPVFYNGPAYRVAVRLRYRLSGGSVVWFFQIYRIDRTFDAAFDRIKSDAAAQTELPIFLGTPEA